MQSIAKKTSVCCILSGFLYVTQLPHLRIRYESHSHVQTVIGNYVSYEIGLDKNFLLIGVCLLYCDKLA